MRLGIFASAFDPFPHPGHLWAMKQALDAGACDGIIAAVQVDPTVERPEKRKPATSFAERMMMLEAIRYVRQTAFYGTEQDLWMLIWRLKPACLIVGEDHQTDRVTGADLAPVFWAKRKPEWSSSRFVDAIYRHATEMLANRHRDAVTQLQRAVQSWLDAKCPCRFPEWDGRQTGGNEATMQEFGGSIAGQHLIRNFGAPHAEQTSKSVPGQGDSQADRGVQGPGMPGVR